MVISVNSSWTWDWYKWKPKRKQQKTYQYSRWLKTGKLHTRESSKSV